MINNNTSFYIPLSILGSIICHYLTSAIYYPELYIRLTYEDLYGEWAQTLFFVIATLFSGYLAYYQSQYKVFFGLLAAACFYVFMEEISWGQRLFGITSPDFFKQNNLQKEINLHNLLTGPYNTTIKSFLEYLISITVITYGLIYPLLLQYKINIAIFFDETLKIPAAPFYLTPNFIFAAIFEPEPFSFNKAEIAKLLVGISLTFLSIHYFFVQYYKLIPTHNDKSWKKDIQLRYNIVLLSAFILAIGSAFVITQWSFQSTNLKKQINQRLDIGYIKFARRYELYEQWKTANNLLGNALENKQSDTTILLKMARNHHRPGDLQAFNRFNQKVILLDLQHLEKNGKSIYA